METETANKKSVQNSDLINIAGYSLQWSPFIGFFPGKQPQHFIYFLYSQLAKFHNNNTPHMSELFSQEIAPMNCYWLSLPHKYSTHHGYLLHLHKAQENDVNHVHKNWIFSS